MDVNKKLSDLFKFLQAIPAEQQKETIALLEAHTNSLKKNLEPADGASASGSTDTDTETKPAQTDATLPKKRGRPRKQGASSSSNHKKDAALPQVETTPENASLAAGRPRRRKHKVTEPPPDIVIKHEVLSEGDSDLEWEPFTEPKESRRSPKKPRGPLEKPRDRQRAPKAKKPSGKRSTKSQNALVVPSLHDADVKQESPAFENTLDEMAALGDIADNSENADSKPGEVTVEERPVRRRKPYVKRERIPFKQRSTCTVCSRVLSSPQCLVQHMRLHSGDTPYHCEHCGKVFKQKPALLIHTRTYHPSDDDPRFHCPDCTFTAFYQHMVDDHFRRQHSHVKDFLCQTCGKGFASKKKLKLHEQVHMPSDRLKCSRCDFATHSSVCMSAHMRNKHSETPKAFICEICGATVKYHCSYKAHMRRHAGEKPYKCGQCDAQFASSSQVMSHMRTHEARREECEICKKRFMTKDHLRRHMVIHSGEKPFSCPRCNYHCNIEANLRKHCLNKHKIVYPPMRKSYVKRLDEIGEIGGDAFKAEAAETELKEAAETIKDTTGKHSNQIPVKTEGENAQVKMLEEQKLVYSETHNEVEYALMELSPMEMAKLATSEDQVLYIVEKEPVASETENQWIIT